MIEPGEKDDRTSNMVENLERLTKRLEKAVTEGEKVLREYRKEIENRER